MSPLNNTVISILFLLAGAVAVYTMMARMGKSQLTHPDAYARWHKIAGWIFVGLFMLMCAFMIGKLENYWEEPPSRITLHMFLALVLFLLLLTKISIPHFFPKLGKNLFMFGFTIYLAAFTLVGITGGYYILRRVEKLPYVYHSELPEHMLDEAFGKELFITKCSTCHMLKDIMKPRSKKAWEDILNEMLILAEPRITVDEMNQILYYLGLTHVPEPFRGPADASLVEKHCLPCHEATEIYEKRFNRTAWMEIVRQMNQYDPEIVPEGKIKDIVDFLVKNQMPSS